MSHESKNGKSKSHENRDSRLESENIINWIIKFIVFLIPLAFWPTLNDAVALPKFTLLLVGAIIICAVVLINVHQRLAKGKGLLIGYRILNLPVAIFLLVVVFNSIRSPLPHHSLWGTYRFYFHGLLAITSFIIFYFAVAYIRREDSADLIKYMLISGGIVSLYGIFQRFGLDFVTWQNISKLRVNSSMGNPNFLGSFLAMLLPPCLGFLFAQEKSKKKLVFMGLFLFMCSTLILTYSRASWFGVSIGLVVFFLSVGWNTLKRNSKYIILIALFLVLFIVLDYSLLHKDGGKSVIERASSIFNLKESGIASRLAGYRICLDMIVEQPFLGRGLDTFVLFFRKYMSMDYLAYAGNLVQAGYAHNELLQYACDLGIIGVGIYLWIIILFYIAVSKLIRDTRYSFINRPLIAGIAGSVTALLVQNQFSFSTITTSLYFWIMLGIVSASISPEDSPDRRDLPGGKTAVEFRVSPRWLQICRAYSKFAVFIFVITGAILLRLALKPIIADYHYCKGMVLLDLRIDEQAMNEVEEAVRLNPRISVYAINLGKIYKKLGDRAPDISDKRAYFKKALSIFQSQIRLNPLNALTYNALGVTWLAMAKIEEDKERALNNAEARLKRALEFDPFLESAHLNLALTFESQAQHIDDPEKRWMEEKKAISEYKELLRINPESAIANFNLGVIYANHKRFIDARRHWQRVLQIEPNHKMARRYLEIIGK